MAVNLLEARQMRRLLSARGHCRGVIRSTLGIVRGFGDEQALAVIKGEPSLPLSVGHTDAVFQRLAKRRQPLAEIGMPFAECTQSEIARIKACHIADEVNHGVAMRDIHVELIERIAAEILEILLNLHFHIVARKVVQILQRGRDELQSCC